MTNGGFVKEQPCFSHTNWYDADVRNANLVTKALDGLLNLLSPLFV